MVGKTSYKCPRMFPSYFPLDTVKRGLVSIIFIISCMAFALICSAMVTQEWTVVKPVRSGLNISVRSTSSMDQEINRFQGLIHFGLFEGKKVLNYGFGNRAYDLKIVCVSKLRVCMYSTKENSTERVKDLQENLFFGRSSQNRTEDSEEETNDSLLVFSVWIMTVSSLSLAGMFAITGAVFSVANVIRNSAEVIFGFLGLMVWNGLGGLCSLVTIFSWMVQFLTKFRMNVMTVDELKQHWVSEYRACMGHSFYLVVIAFLMFLINIATLVLIIKQPWVARQLQAELRKKLSCRKFVPKSPASSVSKKQKEIIMSV